jgi:hypothetical protein
MAKSLIKDLMDQGDEDGAEEELERQERARRRRSLPPAQRRKAQRDAARDTMAWDLPTEVIGAIRDLSGDCDVSQSQIVAYILVDWLNRHAQGEVSLPPRSEWEPTRGRYLWKIPIPELER